MINGFVNLTVAGTVHVALTCVGIIGIALWPMLVKPGPAQWQLRHYMWICRSCG